MSGSVDAMSIAGTQYGSVNDPDATVWATGMQGLNGFNGSGVGVHPAG